MRSSTIWRWKKSRGGTACSCSARAVSCPICAPCVGLPKPRRPATISPRSIARPSPARASLPRRAWQARAFARRAGTFRGTNRQRCVSYITLRAGYFAFRCISPHDQSNGLLRYPRLPKASCDATNARGGNGRMMSRCSPRWRTTRCKIASST